MKHRNTFDDSKMINNGTRYSPFRSGADKKLPTLLHWGPINGGGPKKFS